MSKIIRLLHLNGVKRKFCFYLVNKVYAGTKKFDTKRKILNSIGFEIGENTKVVGPIECTGKLKVGKNCWIGKNFMVNGNGSVEIGDNCDIGPDVVFQTGGHEIGNAERRAGKGKVFFQRVGSGVWIGGRTTILGNTRISNGSVVAGCACVTKDIDENTLVGGVPARVIRRLEL